MSDENESYFKMIFKFIFKIIIYPFILLYKLFKLSLQNPRIIAVVLGIVAIFGTIYYFYINGEDEVKTSQEDDDSETPPGSDDSEETEESDSGETEGSGGGGTTGSGGGGTTRSGWSRLTAAVAGVSTTENATCLSVTECPLGYIKKTGSDSIQCSSNTCEVSLGGVDLNTCCEPEPEPASESASSPYPSAVNCGGSWSDFGECSLECGGGTQTRTYTVTTQPQYGGTPCPASHGSQDSQPCNTEACATCSSYQCPDNNPRAEAVNESCGKTQCDDSNIELCCENIQGVADVVANATCSTVSGNCPDGYLYNTNSAESVCNEPTCDVGISGADLNTCCEQGCTSPGSLPIGYTGSLPATLPVSGGDISGVNCDTNYHGTPTYNCTAGTHYILDGCVSEPQTSGTQSTDLPHCADIKLTDQVASVMRDEIIEDITLEECINHCRDNDNCNSFSYKESTSNCYIYYQSNISHQFNTQYDYYPVKCQP